MAQAFTHAWAHFITHPHELNGARNGIASAAGIGPGTVGSPELPELSAAAPVSKGSKIEPDVSCHHVDRQRGSPLSHTTPRNCNRLLPPWRSKQRFPTLMRGSSAFHVQNPHQCRCTLLGWLGVCKPFLSELPISTCSRSLYLDEKSSAWWRDSGTWLKNNAETLRVQMKQLGANKVQTSVSSQCHISFNICLVTGFSLVVSVTDFLDSCFATASQAWRFPVATSCSFIFRPQGHEHMHTILSTERFFSRENQEWTSWVSHKGFNQSYACI